MTVKLIETRPLTIEKIGEGGLKGRLFVAEQLVDPADNFFLPGGRITFAVYNGDPGGYDALDDVVARGARCTLTIDVVPIE